MRSEHHRLLSPERSKYVAFCCIPCHITHKTLSGWRSFMPGKDLIEDYYGLSLRRIRPHLGTYTTIKTWWGSSETAILLHFWGDEIRISSVEGRHIQWLTLL